MAFPVRFPVALAASCAATFATLAGCAACATLDTDSAGTRTVAAAVTDAAHRRRSVQLPEAAQAQEGLHQSDRLAPGQDAQR